MLKRKGKGISCWIKFTLFLTNEINLSLLLSEAQLTLYHFAFTKLHIVTFIVKVNEATWIVTK